MRLYRFAGSGRLVHTGSLTPASNPAEKERDLIPSGNRESNPLVMAPGMSQTPQVRKCKSQGGRKKTMLTELLLKDFCCFPLVLINTHARFSKDWLLLTSVAFLT